MYRTCICITLSIIVLHMASIYPTAQTDEPSMEEVILEKYGDPVRLSLAYHRSPGWVLRKCCIILQKEGIIGQHLSKEGVVYTQRRNVQYIIDRIFYKNGIENTGSSNAQRRFGVTQRQLNFNDESQALGHTQTQLSSVQQQVSNGERSLNTTQLLLPHARSQLNFNSEYGLFRNARRQLHFN